MIPDRKELWLAKQPAFIEQMFSPRLIHDLTTQAKTCPALIQSLGVPVPGMYIYGRVGVGKTIMAAWAMIKEKEFSWIHRCSPKFCFITVADLLFSFKCSYESQRKSGATPPISYVKFNAGYKYERYVQGTENEHQILQRFLDYDLLVLDDFGVEKITDWSFQMLYMLINGRYEAMKKTIFTSNLDLSQLGEKLNDDRIPSRIKAMGQIVKLNGEDLRK